VQDQQPLFLCHRPAWAAGLAAPLLHPAFGQFLLDVRDAAVSTRRDTNFAADFCHHALLMYEKEWDRQTAMVCATKIWVVWTNFSIRVIDWLSANP